MYRFHKFIQLKNFKSSSSYLTEPLSSCCYSTTAVTNSQQQQEQNNIKIPNRVHRSSTDILLALSSTVQNDPTAAHYKYHDDPYLIPTTNISKKVYAMAQESGRKAARWILQEHKNLFQHSVAQPPIKAFTPQIVFHKKSNVNEEILKNLVTNHQVNDAIFVYKLMKEKNLDVSNDLRQELLELVCYYNHDNQVSEEYIEERWFKQSTGQTGTGGSGNRIDRQRKTWKDNDLAEQIFNETETKTAEMYSSLIRGMCKYYQTEKAWQLFQEGLEKDIIYDVSTYNAIISIVSFLKDTGELRWDLCKELLNQMKDRKLKPNLGTMNSLLSTVSTIGNYRLAKMATLTILNEFKKLNIEPCLATWYYVLITLCRERGPVISHVLHDIMNYIDNKEFQIYDIKDTYFFVTAMDICRNHLNDTKLAKRVNKLLHTGYNYNFIGDSYKESIYYRHYFVLLCQNEALETFFDEIYEVFVPNIYIPEPGIMEEILKSIDNNDGIKYIPKIWSDMIIFDHIQRENLIIRILNIMTTKRLNILNNDENLNENYYNEKFSIIAWDIFQRINDMNDINNDNINRTNTRPTRPQQKLYFTGQILGNILQLLCRNNDYDKASIVFTKIDKCQHQISGIPSVESLLDYIDLCIKNKKPTQCINCLEYCLENGLIMNINELIKKIQNGFTLSEEHLLKLKNLVGEK